MPSFFGIRFHRLFSPTLSTTLALICWFHCPARSTITVLATHQTLNRFGLEGLGFRAIGLRK